MSTEKIAINTNIINVDDVRLLLQELPISDLQLSLTPCPQQRPQIVFLDLDQTLIPTNLIMCNLNDRNVLREKILNSDFYKVLHNVLRTVAMAPHVVKIAIVTNASTPAVHQLYLQDVLPELAVMIERYNIEIRSTQYWVQKLGPPPDPKNSVAFLQFYVGVKRCEFLRIIRNVICDHPGEEFDIISVGDQMAEIDAACKLGGERLPIVSIKLLMILEDSQKGETIDEYLQSFTEYLSHLRDNLNQLLTTSRETSCQQKWVYKSPSTTNTQVSIWLPRVGNMMFSISKFCPDSQMKLPFFLPIKYINYKKGSPLDLLLSSQR